MKRKIKPKDDLSQELLRILLFWVIYFAILVVIYTTTKGNPTPKIWGIVLLSLWLAVNTVSRGEGKYWLIINLAELFVHS